MSTFTSEAEDMNINDNIVYQNAEPGTLYLLNQNDLDDLVRDFYLSKTGSELLVYKLKQWNFLQPNCKAIIYKSRHVAISTFYHSSDNVC